MNEYRTGLLAWDNESGDFDFPLHGAGWKVSLSRGVDEQVTQYEVIIHAKSLVTAQRTLELICASHSLFMGDPPLFGIKPRLVAHNELEPRADLFPLGIKECSYPSFSASGIPIACEIAAKASRDRNLVYGILKRSYSVDLYSQCCMDLEPFVSPHFGTSPFPSDHILFANAIVICYSSIEEIGLDVRASSGKPSRVKGEWNPVVLHDLEERLRRKGIDLNDSILWTVRGSKRRLEAKRDIPSIRKAPWAWGQVRDCEVEVVDAIAYSEWLRSHVAAHKTKDVTKVLNGYDVINIQHLSRRLLLETLGYWRWHE